MNTLNKTQLAFILDIKAEDARLKMTHAWCKIHAIKNDAFLNLKDKVEDPYPAAMEISVLAEGLNLPNLQAMVDDIHNNYLVRPATKKWILCDYPEKEIKSMLVKGKGKALALPKALHSLLSAKTIAEVKREWTERYVTEDCGFFVK